MVPVLMAKVKVPGWTPIKEPEKFFEVKMVAESAVAKSSLRSFDEVKDQRLNKPLDADRAVLQGDLLTKEQQSLVDNLLPGVRAVGVKVTPVSLAGGFVLQGARVDVICTTRSNDPSSRVILQGMLVLAVDTQDQRVAEQKSVLGQTVTLAATPEEATRLTLAASVGELQLMPKGNADTKRMTNVVARMSDLDKPLQSSGRQHKETEGMPPPSVTTTTPLPPLPEEKDPAKDPVKETAPMEKPRKRHVMTLINGTSREKAVFIEGDNDEDGPSATPARKDDKPEPKPEPKKEEAKAPATPAAPSATTKTSPTRRN